MKYKYHPNTKEELVKAIKKEIFEVQGTSDNPNWKANLNCIDTSNITDMSFLFSKRYGLYKFNGNISQWDVSSVKDMESMFKESKFNGDISKWDVSNVKDMEGMFAVSKFNGNISQWDVSNVKSMYWMFADSQFNGDISRWDVSSVENMSGMFHNSIFNGDISKWNVSNVKDMSWMFYDSKFNGNISQWDVSNVKDMSYMFTNSQFNGNINEWDVSSVETMSGMFRNSKFNGDISKWDVSNVRYMEEMFKNAEFNGDIGDWDVSDKMRKKTKLNNISVKEDSGIIPDKVVSLNTLKRIINNIYKFYFYKKSILLKALPNIEQNLFLEIDKDIIPEELFIVNNELRKKYGESAKKILNKYLNVSFNKEELNKILGKNSDLLDKSYIKRISEIYEKYENKEERKKALAATVVIPYTKENKLQLKKEFGKKDNNEIQISS